MFERTYIFQSPSFLVSMLDFGGVITVVKGSMAIATPKFDGELFVRGHDKQIHGSGDRHRSFPGGIILVGGFNPSQIPKICSSFIGFHFPRNYGLKIPKIFELPPPRIPKPTQHRHSQPNLRFTKKSQMWCGREPRILWPLNGGYKHPYLGGKIFEKLVLMEERNPIPKHQACINKTLVNNLINYRSLNLVRLPDFHQPSINNITWKNPILVTFTWNWFTSTGSGNLKKHTLMAGQPTPPNVPPPELLTIGFP